MTGNSLQQSVSKAELRRLLGDRKIQRHYTEADLALDVEYAQE